MTSFRAVLFDLDGTLLDTLEDIADSVNRVLCRSGFPEHGLEKYKYFIGDGMDILVRRALPTGGLDETTIAGCLEAVREEYARHWADKTHFYEGIPEMLDWLVSRKFQISILSNKPDVFTRATVERFLSRWPFHPVLGARPSVPKKPDASGAFEVAKITGIAPEKFFYLGDTDTDMKTAVSAGMFPVGVLWGFRPAEELFEAGAKIVLSRPMELSDLLRNLSLLD
ncbi:MAG: HAD family hydrolase [bacterium]